MMRTILLIGLLAFGAQEEKGFRAGAAASNITPPLGEPIVGNWNSPPATKIHDELHARCLALDDGKSKLVFVICDNVGIPREVFDEARRIAAEETGLAPDRFLFSATHTHSATSARGDKPLEKDYARFLVRRMADGARRALGNLEPARIGWGSAQAPEHVFNRRYHLKEGVKIPDPFGGEDKVLMNPGVGNPNVVRPAGPVDPEVSFLILRAKKDDRPIAVLANYSLHYVGGVPEGHVSADYFAVVAERLGELFKVEKSDPPFVGILSNGTSGDVNNVDVLGKPERLPPYEKMKRVASSVAEKIFAAAGAAPVRDHVTLDARVKELVLRNRKPDADRVARAKEILGRPKDAKPAHAREVAYARRSVELADAPDTVSVPIQAFRLGDWAIAAIPFEVFTDIGLEIKKTTPFERTFTISLANGSYGYLPTPEHHALGGYETWLGTNRVEVEASRKIVATVQELLKELKSQP
jgi:neutral ceramidase